MGDNPPANPDDLTAAAKRFYAAAEELRRIHSVLTNRTQDLVNGSDAWVGSSSEQFQGAWERFGDDTLSSATTLERSANVLNALATTIANVQTSPAGKLVRGIDSGRVQIVPNQVRILIPGADVVHASEAVNAYKVVSDGYDQAVADGASGFEGAAHGTTSGARLSGGVDSTAVGIAQMGWSAAMQAAAGQNTAAAGYTQTATDVGAHATSPGAKSNDAAPVAPGFFTSAASGDGTTSGAASFGGGNGGNESDAGDEPSASGERATAGDHARDGKANGQGQTRTYSRADLGASPSDAALVAARQQGSGAAALA